MEITEDHRREIKEYLDLLDLTADIPTEFPPVKNEKLYLHGVLMYFFPFTSYRSAF